MSLWTGVTLGAEAGDCAGSAAQRLDAANIRVVRVMGYRSFMVGLVLKIESVFAFGGNTVPGCCLWFFHLLTWDGKFVAIVTLGVATDRTAFALHGVGEQASLHCLPRRVGCIPHSLHDHKPSQVPLSVKNATSGGDAMRGNPSPFS